MVELLSLKQKTKVDELVRSVPRPASGLPINALAKWHTLPLIAKLPMLKCPTRTIIFSRGKLGQKLWQAGEFRLYDPYCYTVRVDYDALHDPHLKEYFKKENVLKHLRQIGKITLKNDVICSLKEFNGYRQLLQRYHLDLVLKELNRRETEKYDKAMVTHAETIAQDECENFSKQQSTRTPEQMKEIVAEMERQRQEKFQKTLQHYQTVIQSMEAYKRYLKQVLEYQWKMYSIKIKKKQMYAKDMEKRKIIMLKKFLAMREIRIRSHKRKHIAQKLEKKHEKETIAWAKRLEMREKLHERQTKLLDEADRNREKNIKLRKEKVERQWRRDRAAIAKRTLLKKQKRKRRKHVENQLADKSAYTLGHFDSKRAEVNETSHFSINKLTQKDITKVVNIVLDYEEIENEKEKLLSGKDGAIKLAKYILKVVLENFKEDLSKDTQALKLTRNRILKQFEMLKFNLIMGVAKLLSGGNDTISVSEKSEKGSLRDFTDFRCVTFGTVTVHEKSSSAEDSDDRDLKRAKTRTPTPFCSLTSLIPAVFEADEDNAENYMYPDEPRQFQGQPQSLFCFLSKEERIFIEHFYIKFKRDLKVGVTRRVFIALDCYRNNRILDPRKELLEIDRKYLAAAMAKSILGYNLNQYNFYSNLRLCISALSADIIWELQKHLLRPERDPRHLTRPKCKCYYKYVK